MNNSDSFRDRILRYAKEKYGTLPEYLWMRYPDYAVLRHADNKKWYCIIMDLPKKKLGLPDDGRSDVLNVKLPDPLMRDLLIKKDGYFRGYHFAGESWVSILLDSTVPLEEILIWLDRSFAVTASKQGQRETRQPKEWIVPANPKYYDVERAFRSSDEVDWKQGKGIRSGDTVYMYVAAPVSAILYKCTVTETDIPYAFRSENLTIDALMKLKLEKEYDKNLFTFQLLSKEYGISAVRGPRSVPLHLSKALKEQGKDTKGRS